MKIGILTFHWAANHGAILQAYALVNFLKENIPYSDVDVIDYYPKRYEKSFVNSIKTKNIHQLNRNLTELKKDKLLSSFRKELPLTKRFYSGAELKNFPNDYDVLIVGSDQVWNEFYTLKGEGKNTFVYYLPFNKKVTKLSYAASFGYTKYKDDIAKLVKPYLEDFKAISVREDSGKSIVTKMGLEATTVCDPTALLAKTDFEKFLKSSTPINYIAYYFLRGKKKELKAKLKKTADVVDIEMMPISDWLSHINNAKILITNSYHGMMFAMKFHTPFYVFCESVTLSGMNDRFNTVLARLGLCDRMICKTDEIDIDKKIDWEAVDSKMKDFAESSKKFLTDNIKTTQ